jgi:catechol 2,3-dioxygenase-like lactoylglutathione lyase family enzyme
MQPLAIHHVSINVSDVAKGVTFYTEVLGGSLRGDRPDFGFGGAWIDFGPEQLHLIEAPTPERLGQHFAVRVADIESTVAELRGKGYEVSDPVPVNANFQAFIDDPFGNTVELHQVGA